MPIEHSPATGLPPDLEHRWVSEALGMIMTMRADDAQRWDPDALVELAKSFSLGALGFSVGGVTAFYPTDVPGHPVSPSLGQRDLVDETLRALHAAGVRAFGRIDPSLGSADELERHPDRFARTKDGAPLRLHDFYMTCPSGDHFNGFMLEVVREIVERYPLDGLWANAAQFSPWSAPRCFCSNCRSRFEQASGDKFPEVEDWSDPVWKRYNEWRYHRISDWNRSVHQLIRSVRPSCAWLPLSQVIESWDHTRKGGWDVDLTSAHADGTVLEAQRRYCNLWWPGMEARYAHAMSPDHGAAITVSYFYPWWRFTHAPVAENRVWAAQMVANGSRPWLHLTGYFSEYFDRRGMKPMQQLFGLFDARDDVYGHHRSAAEVALVYSRTNLDYAGGAQPDLNYLDGFRGAYNALMDGHLPFDLLSDKAITAERLARYRCVLLPNLACIGDETIAELERYVSDGGHLVATYRTGFCDPWGEARTEPAIARWLGVRYRGVTRPDLKAAYALIGRRDHAVLADIGDTDLLPLAGSVCEFDAGDGSDADVLRLIPPVEARPGSGMSVPEFNVAGTVADVPLLLTGNIGKGSIAYFPWEPDRIGFHFGLRDPMRLLANAVRSAAGWRELVTVEAPGLIDVSVMDGDRDRVVHLVNFNSASGVRSPHRRAIEDVIPLHELRIGIRLPAARQAISVERVVEGGSLPFEQNDDGVVHLTLPVLREFESIRVEWAAQGS